MISSHLTALGPPPGSPAFWIAAFLSIVALMLLIVAIQGGNERKKLSRMLEKSRLRLAAEEQRAAEVGPLRAALEAERDRRALSESRAAAGEARLEEQRRALEETRTQLDTQFRATTADLLKDARAQFLERAKETFDLYKQSASAEGEARRRALDDLLKPVSETLTRYEKGLAELREEQARARGQLAGQIGELAKQTYEVRAEANKLATALRAGPKTRGRWGEEQLRNVVEMAGMTSHVDFTEQTSHADGDQRKIPDMIVKLPGERVIAVDSKVSLGAFLDAVEAETDDARQVALSRHADDIWNHVKALAAKDYAASLKDALDYTVMFIPGESYFSAALEARPSLHQDAFERKILIATPTILIAVLKSAALNWRQEKTNEHAYKVAALAKELYDSLGTLAGNLRSLGKSLQSSVKHYNAAVGGFEGRVLSRARNFAAYELPGIDRAIEDVPEAEAAVRALRSDADMLLDFDTDETAAQEDDAA